MVKEYSDAGLIYSVLFESIPQAYEDFVDDDYMCLLKTDDSFLYYNFIPYSVTEFDIDWGDPQLDFNFYEQLCELRIIATQELEPVAEFDEYCAFYNAYQKQAIEWMPRITKDLLTTGWIHENDIGWYKLFPADNKLDKNATQAVANSVVTRGIYAAGHSINMEYEPDKTF